jgi:hypothetical protein
MNIQDLMTVVTDEDVKRARDFISDNLGKPHDQPAMLAWTLSLERRIAALEAAMSTTE